MKTAHIYYKNYVLTPETREHAVAKGYENPEARAKENSNLYYKLAGSDPNKEQVTIDKDRFKNHWTKLSEEEVSSSHISELERIWDKYNRYPANPLSAQNDGDPDSHNQPTIEEAGVNHTSMSVGDVVRVEDRYYIVAGVGFLRLYLK